jgi:O-methyltransferase involved in polyketide biosynthesis
MSPRGWRFTTRYGDRLTYVEADLPAMAARKRRALERMGSLGDGHRVADVDALRDQGPLSLAALASTLAPEGGLAIVTEGLLTYFDEDDVIGMWRRFARELRGFSAGLYLADIRIGGSDRRVLDRAFQAALSSFVARPVHVHFDGEAAAVDALRAAGFAEARAFPYHQAMRIDRKSALQRIRGRHISTFDLIEETEIEAGLKRAEAELPAEVEYGREWLIVVASCSPAS